MTKRSWGRGLLLVGFGAPTFHFFISSTSYFPVVKKCHGTWESETSIQVTSGHCRDDFGEAITTEVSSVKWAELHKIVIIHTNTYWDLLSTRSWAQT